MMKYIARKADEHGIIQYTEKEHQVWQQLYNRQINLIQARACDEFISGINQLKLSANKIPQCNELSRRLVELTGWQVSPVEALISFDEFFSLLGNKKFPVATFIRLPEEIDYIKEPDIFHEIFGHCPMLTNQDFANFTYQVGKLGLELNLQDRVYLARLYWFTVEFGLINTAQGLRIYGGGILSSKGETKYALDSEKPLRLDFDLLTVLRTPYRYDEMQLTYFVINEFAELYQLINKPALLAAISEAKNLGMLENRHQKPEDNPRSC